MPHSARHSIFPDVVQQHEIALVTRGGNLPARYCVPDTTVGLAHVATVAEATFGQMRTKLRKAMVEAIGQDLPQPDLAQSGRVDYEATFLARQLEHHSTDGRVAALVHGFADLANAEIRARKGRVEQRGLTDARRAS